MWGHYVQNFVALPMKEKPKPDSPIYKSRLYDESQLHFEPIAQDAVWPQNIYQAQRAAYKAGLLWNKKKN